MAEKKKLVSEITSMDVDFAQWYTDIVKKAEMADYSSVKGCIIMRPYAQALWENIQHTLDGMFKETGSRECSNADASFRKACCRRKPTTLRASRRSVHG